MKTKPRKKYPDSTLMTFSMFSFSLEFRLVGKRKSFPSFFSYSFTFGIKRILHRLLRQQGHLNISQPLRVFSPHLGYQTLVTFWQPFTPIAVLLRAPLPFSLAENNLKATPSLKVWLLKKRGIKKKKRGMSL